MKRCLNTTVFLHTFGPIRNFKFGWAFALGNHSICRKSVDGL